MRRGLLAGLMLAIAVGCAPPRTDGIVLERIYTPPLSGTGYGIGSCTGSAGGTVVVGTCQGVVFYNASERWTLILKGDDGKVWSYSATPEQWAAAVVGQRFAP